MDFGYINLDRFTPYMNNGQTPSRASVPLKSGQWICKTWILKRMACLDSGWSEWIWELTPGIASNPLVINNGGSGSIRNNGVSGSGSHKLKWKGIQNSSTKNITNVAKTEKNPPFAELNKVKFIFWKQNESLGVFT